MESVVVERVLEEVLLISCLYGVPILCETKYFDECSQHISVYSRLVEKMVTHSDKVAVEKEG